MSWNTKPTPAYTILVSSNPVTSAAPAKPPPPLHPPPPPLRLLLPRPLASFALETTAGNIVWQTEHPPAPLLFPIPPRHSTARRPHVLLQQKKQQQKRAECTSKNHSLPAAVLAPCPAVDPLPPAGTVSHLVAHVGVRLRWQVTDG